MAAAVDEKARAVLEAAMEAVGGRKRLQRVTDMVITATHALYTDTIRYRSPNRISRESRFPWGVVHIGYDGTSSWHTDKDGKLVLEEGKKIPAVQWLFHKVEVLLLVPLETEAKTIEYLGGKNVYYFEDGETVRKVADVLRVTFPDGWVFRLYFARDTRLLVKSEFRHTSHQSRYVERFFTRYKKVRSILFPRRVYEYNHQSGRFTRVKIDYEVNVGLKRRTFKMPSAKEVS
ncbi:MAG: hypothetical protein DRP82_05560 [Planctomycetota bacterium]|nr:MAG: hypothetical protein DRP82_05560 [Planctomycetota bacterium]